MNFLFVLAVGLLAGTISGIVGTGSSIMLMPVLVYQYGPKQAVPIMAIAAVMANLSRILAWWREVDWRACAAYSIPGIPAAALGARTLLALPSHAVDVSIGLFLIAMVPGQPVPRRHHRNQEQADGDIDRARRQRQQGAGAERRGRNARNRIGGAGAPIDLAPPGEDARQIGHDSGNRHDRDGLFRPVLIDQDRHQHDRGAGADDAADGAGDEPHREDENEIHEGLVSSESMAVRILRQRGTPG